MSQKFTKPVVAVSYTLLYSMATLSIDSISRPALKTASLLCVQQSHDYIEKKDSAQGSVISLF
jgi:hypothetical protein